MPKYNANKVKQIMSIRDNQINIDAQPEFFNLPNAVELMIERLEKAEKSNAELVGYEANYWYQVTRNLNDRLLEMFKSAKEEK